MTRVIGLISGTSVDGIDAALVEISGTDVDLKIELLAGVTYPYPVELRERILAVCAGSARGIKEEEIRPLIDKYTDKRLLGIFGEPGVNILRLNYALDLQDINRKQNQ
jgi:1,6-anhydro-N-acetylmuramate kinase